MVVNSKSLCVSAFSAALLLNPSALQGAWPVLVREVLHSKRFGGRVSHSPHLQKMQPLDNLELLLCSFKGPQGQGGRFPSWFSLFPASWTRTALSSTTAWPEVSFSSVCCAPWWLHAHSSPVRDHKTAWARGAGDLRDSQGLIPYCAWEETEAPLCKTGFHFCTHTWFVRVSLFLVARSRWPGL